MALTVTVGKNAGLTSQFATKISIFAIVPLFVAGLIMFLRMPKESEIEEAKAID